jgi:hypothetical protein
LVALIVACSAIVIAILYRSKLVEVRNSLILPYVPANQVAIWHRRSCCIALIAVISEDGFRGAGAAQSPMTITKWQNLNQQVQLQALIVSDGCSYQ